MIKVSQTVGVFILLGSLLLIGGCGKKAKINSRDKISAAHQQFRTIASPRGYSIDAPKSWTSMPSTEVVDVMLMAPIRKGASFNSNINVVVEKLPVNISVKKYTQQSLQMMSLVFPHYVQLSSNKFDAGITGEKIVYTGELNSGLKLQNCVYLFTAGRKGYVITGSSTPEMFATFEPQFDLIAQSFKITTK